MRSAATGALRAMLQLLQQLIDRSRGAARAITASTSRHAYRCRRYARICAPRTLARRPQVGALERAPSTTRIVATRVQGERHGRSSIVRNKSRNRSRLRGAGNCLAMTRTRCRIEEVLIVARHAESLAHVVIELALQDVRVPLSAVAADDTPCRRPMMALSCRRWSAR